MTRETVAVIKVRPDREYPHLVESQASYADDPHVYYAYGADCHEAVINANELKHEYDVDVQLPGLRRRHSPVNVGHARRRQAMLQMSREKVTNDETPDPTFWFSDSEEPNRTERWLTIFFYIAIGLTLAFIVTVLALAMQGGS